MLLRPFPICASLSTSAPSRTTSQKLRDLRKCNQPSAQAAEARLCLSWRESLAEPTCRFAEAGNLSACADGDSTALEQRVFLTSVLEKRIVMCIQASFPQPALLNTPSRLLLTRVASTQKNRQLNALQPPPSLRIPHISQTSPNPFLPHDVKGPQCQYHSYSLKPPQRGTATLASLPNVPPSRCSSTIATRIALFWQLPTVTPA